MPAAALAGETGLATDLKRVSTTPAFSFITPNLCDDGHDCPCTNQQSGASALADIDTFLETWVPLITSSPAFRDNGLLEITFDGTISGTPYNHYSSLASWETLLGVPRLAYAATVPATFGADVFTAASG